MRDKRFALIFCILLVAQILLSNFLDITQYYTIALLPAMMLCLPFSSGTVTNLVIAFVTGFITDFFSGGVLGLTSAALLPVVFLRNPVVRIFFDEETYSRMDTLSIQRLGLLRIIVCCAIMLIIYLVIYILLDGAGIRTPGFNLMRLGISFAGNLLLSVIVLDLLLGHNEKR